MKLTEGTYYSASEGDLPLRVMDAPLQSRVERTEVMRRVAHFIRFENQPAEASHNFYLPLPMPHGRQLRLFLSDGTSSGPRFYEIVNRTIQALAIPATRIKEVDSGEWNEFQRPGVYLVYGTDEEGTEKLYVGKGEDVAHRVQGHPEKLEMEVTSLLLFTNKDENLNASQVSWLESRLVSAVKEAKRISIENKQHPTIPNLPKAELATVSEYYDDLVLIALTAGFEYLTKPKRSTSAASTSANVKGSNGKGPEFKIHQPTKDLTALGYLSDDGFVVKKGSDAKATPNASLQVISWLTNREKLIKQGVLIESEEDPAKLKFTVDYPFATSSEAASIVVGNNFSGNKNWKTEAGQSLGDYLDSQSGSNA